MPDLSPDKKGGKPDELTMGENKMLLMGVLCSGGAKVDYERLGALMNMKRASAVSMYGRAVRKLEKVYGVSAEGGTAKSPAKSPTKQAGGRKRRKKNQDPNLESEPEPEVKVEAKNDVPDEAKEEDLFTSKSQRTD
ncbi:hypothetical protein N7499_007345 [Penicillium canescens]|nr:hypothetical protein N7499_007345 [Penicillium canescens]KAJ6175732.1 hypothetical protein N7485_002646 [Penicillium canescens]